MYSVSVICVTCLVILKICQFPTMLRSTAFRSMTPAPELVEIPPEHRNVFTTSGGESRLDRYCRESSGSASSLSLGGRGSWLVSGTPWSDPGHPEGIGVSGSRPIPVSYLERKVPASLPVSLTPQSQTGTSTRRNPCRERSRLHCSQVERKIF